METVAVHGLTYPPVLVKPWLSEGCVVVECVSTERNTTHVVASEEVRSEGSGVAGIVDPLVNGEVDPVYPGLRVVE